MDLVMQQYRDLRRNGTFNEINAFSAARSTCVAYLREIGLRTSPCTILVPRSRNTESASSRLGLRLNPTIALSGGGDFYPSPLLQWYLDQIDALAAAEPSAASFASEVAALEDNATNDLFGDELAVFLAVSSVAAASVYYWSDDATWYGLEPELAEMPWWVKPIWRVAKADIAGGVAGAAGGVVLGGPGGAATGATAGAGAASLYEATIAILDCMAPEQICQ